MKKIVAFILFLTSVIVAGAQDFRINDSGYFNHEGVDAMAFDDFYPEGHQGGISFIMNGKRVATNGDIRFDETPGQWQPVPRKIERTIDGQKIVTRLCYPDSSRHETGFNPMVYPDVQLHYTVTLEPSGKGFLVTVDLEQPIPSELIGKAGFNMEFFPGELFGKPWIMDDKAGIYPQQPNSPVIEQESYLDVTVWPGEFLRYRYLEADFSDVTEPGLYCVRYGGSSSSVFRIGSDVYDRGVWQPVVEYFLPVQMCHMRVSEKYRVWHDTCHMDDARLAPAGNHIDGYVQPEDDMTSYEALDVVEGINVGGWHDAGDFDLRIESQAGECYILAKAYEAFRPELDVTAIDQQNHLVEIHQPDGRNDILQQVEHGALSVVNGYLALGRLYRGIICNNLRQYVLLGDAAAMTDGVAGNDDDRWVFTEDNPRREISTAAELAATSRVLRGFNDTLSVHCVNIAAEIFAAALEAGRKDMGLFHAAAELYQTTGESRYLDYIIAGWDRCLESVGSCAWYLAPVEREMAGQKKYRKQCAAFREALSAYARELEMLSAETPYGVPYRPNIWGAGWDIQAFGYRHYFLAKTYPDIFSPEQVYNALNFILGCHPGLNTQSFASGVGAKSATVGYGLNRADWSYIPGGVVSGTALIRPDFPELLVFPFLWQQVEYVLGGGSSHYMFLVLAAKDLLQ